MLVPLALLAIGAIFSGWYFHEWFIGAETGGGFWKGSLAFNEHLMHAMHEVPIWVKYSATAVMLAGFGIAWMAYIKDTSIPARFTATFSGLYQFLLNKWYWDELYDLLFVRPSLWIGRQFWQRGDIGTIDRFGPHGAAELVQQGSKLAARFQSGYLYSYAFVMLLGLVGLATWMIVQ